MALNLIQWAGKTYRLDLDSPKVGEMAIMRMFTGMNWLPMIDEIRQGNDVAIAAALWLMLNRNGEPCKIDAVPWPDGLGPMDLLYAVTNGTQVAAAEDADAGAADPNTGKADSTPNSPPTSTSATSEPPTSSPSPESESPRRLSTA